MSLKFIKVAALVGSSISFGGNFYISAFAIPAMLSPCSYKAEGQGVVLPAKVLQMQWQHVYDTGKRFFPLLIVGTSALYLYLAYNVPAEARPLYLLAACCGVSIVPYTLAVMMPNIKRIQGEIKEEDTQVGLRLRDDIKTWSRMNCGRAVLLGVAFLAGAWAAVDSS
ncbi:uncharacterized protein LACBIDRAFT_309543 [Laccaria bicolor S238N-H82]|uniref:Predicted protein n=1 Tax=Laccaria bicolor (strain S238N-H82 / ATCC MYA-4686) TaxID=486041 RepID=B0DSJ9_LACBS|nr:uncharacterized protein LACBIDRAFT_309543 [Laccaria bicolor S238N-H82]EDR02484.1 predicted protein [Laccaria bicolor S238N-H82]|eukprot:XP_001886847.1 predicted protein [Laccaria bicolor S238N-H82]